MFYNLYNKIYDYELYLCKPNKTIITTINYTDINYTQNFRTYNELEFELPYFENGWMKIKDNTFNLLNPSFLVLLNIRHGDDIIYEEYFVIDNPQPKLDSDGKIKTSIHCYSAEYVTFNNRKLRSYEEVKVLYDVDNSYGGGIVNYMLDQLYNTYSVGYINPKYIGIYHSFNYSSSTYKQVLDDLQTVYNCYILFDNVNNEINIYSPEEVGESSGLILCDENYIKSLSYQTKNSELITRLRVYGKDNISITAFNITGQMYIDNFDWFQNNGYFSDSLNNTMNVYKSLLTSKQGDFTTYLTQLDSLNTSLLTKENELNDLNTQKEVLEDTLDTAKNNNRRNTPDYDSAYVEYQSKLTEITNKQSEIDVVQSQIDAVNINISTLQSEISYTNNFTTEQLQELSIFIYEDDLKLDSCSDEQQLYEYATQYIVKKSVPPIDIDIDMVDVFSVNNSSIINDRSKIVLGNFVYIDVPEIGFDYYLTRITKITHSKLSNSLSITLSNQDKLNADINYLNDIFKKSSQAADTVEVNKEDYASYIQQKYSILFQNTTIDVDSNPLQVGDNVINRRGYLGTNLGGYGELQVKNDKIVFSKDNWQTFYTLLSADGLYLETNNGKSRIVITPEYGIQIDKLVSDVWDNIFYVDSSTGNVILDGGYIHLLTEDNKKQIYIDPANGIRFMRDITYDSSKTYFYGNIVFYSSNYYKCTRDDTIGISNILPTDITYWQSTSAPDSNNSGFQDIITLNSNGDGIFTGSIYGSRFYGGDFDSGYIKIGNEGNLADVQIFRGSGGGSYPAFSIYDDLGVMTLKAGDGSTMPTSFLSSGGGTTYPYNTWDCQYASFTGLKDASGNYYATQQWVIDNFMPL